MAFWNIANTPVTVIPAGSLAQADYIFQNTGSNTIYISDQQNVTADATSLAIAAGTPFTWSKSDSLYAVCSAGNPSTLFGTANGAQVGTSIAALLTPTAQYVIAAATATLYRSNYTLSPGIYTIAVTPNTTIVNIDFYDVNGALITSVVSTSGSNLTVNLATTAVQFDYWTSSGGAANASISITKSGTNIPFVSGTLYTFTTSQVISLVGDGYFLLVGAGGGGGAGNATGGGGGGGSGGFVGGRIKLTTPISFVAGIGGTSIAGNGLANSGGSSTFAGFTANGGGGGGGGGGGAAGTAGTPNGGAGGAGSGGISANGSPGNSSANSNTIFAFITIGTTGGGGGGGGSNSFPSGGVGGGSGIGNGGNGGTWLLNNASNGVNGGGGGGGSSAGLLGGTGGNGVLYIII